MRTPHLLAALLALAAALSACAVPASPQPKLTAHTAQLTGRSWLVDEPAALVAALPPLPLALPDSPPATPDQAVLVAWGDAPASRWMELGLRAIRAEALAPPHAARALMLLAVAVNDATTAAAAARSAGREASEHAAVAEAAVRVLALTHPHLSLPAHEVEAAIWAGAWRGEATAAGVFTGRHLGAAVGDVVVAWAAADGSAEQTGAIAALSGAPGSWRPTAPAFEPAQLPGWGRVRTVAAGDLAGLRAPAPPAWGSPEMEAQVDAFAAAQAALGDAERELARSWAAGPRTLTPAGLWMERAVGLAATHRLPHAEAAGLYAALGVALHDAAVACWDSKYRYLVARPATVMQERTDNWLPLLPTPPHPAYPSGHAALSGAASAILAAALPGEAETLRDLAGDAARSRVYGGIHWPMDGEAGLDQGARVAAAVLASVHDK